MSSLATDKRLEVSGPAAATDDPIAKINKLICDLAPDNREPRKLIEILSLLNNEQLLSSLKLQASEYLQSFSYKPILSQESDGKTVFKDAIRFIPDPATLDRVVDIAMMSAANAENGHRVIRDVILKPEVLAKLAVIYEHGFMSGANTVQKKEELVSRHIRLAVEEDALLRFLKLTDRTQPENSQQLYSKALKDPEFYALAAVAHRWACNKNKINPIDTAVQTQNEAVCTNIRNSVIDLAGLSEQRINPNQILSNLRTLAPIPNDPSVNIGESLFFKTLLDPNTLSLSQYILDGYERGLSNVEISVDMLPFDHSKRLPDEFQADEIARTRALAKLLGMSVTVHSPIVGPLHSKTKFTAILEDAADNVELMKKTLDLAHSLGAKTVVMHLSDRLNPEAISAYTEIAVHAAGMKAADSSALRLACENYMSKTRPDGSRPFPTMNEHFDSFRQIVRAVARQTIAQGGDPASALDNLAVLLDSAHFNLVSDFDEDPLKAVFDLMKLSNQLADDLNGDPALGPALKKTGFDPAGFAKNLLAQLHLNQNIGPIAFIIGGVDYNADIHNPVESVGTIDTIGFVAAVSDFGFGAGTDGKSSLVVLAEQKQPLSPGGLQILHQALKDSPATLLDPGNERVQSFVELGKRAIESWAQRNPDEFRQISELLIEPASTSPREHYAYLAGRFGISHLHEHLLKRAYHHIMSAQVDNDWLTHTEQSPFAGVSVSRHPPGDIIIRKGTTLDAARQEGSNKCYLTMKGEVAVKTDKNDVILPTGVPFGEAMFLSGSPRNADVIAGPNGAELVEISENDFWRMYKLFAPFADRIEARVKASVRL